LKVIQNRALKRITEERQEEARNIKEGWRKLRNEELRNLYSSSNITMEIGSSKMRLAGRVKSVGI
jgi:hypothetical protein